jgi:hypothetical protein
MKPVKKIGSFFELVLFQNSSFKHTIESANSIQGIFMVVFGNSIIHSIIHFASAMEKKNG